MSLHNEQDVLKDKMIFGIDLGTTNSGITVWDPAQKKVVILSAQRHRPLTPSVVGWSPASHSWIVGEKAKKLGQKCPDRVAYSIKRYIGRWFTDPEVMHSRQDLNYRLISGGGIDQLRDIIVDFGRDQTGQPLHLAAPEVSAKVLYRLREKAAATLGIDMEDVKYAVITVPAYFNVLQRKATNLAGRLAGLEVVDILNEPTAAALAYSDMVLQEDERRILVYDLGGGTFDISLLDASRDDYGYAFYTRVVDGHTRLGGDDIDNQMVIWLMGQIQEKYGHIVRADDLVSRERIRQVAEIAKINLSTEQVVKVSLPDLDLGSGSPFDIELEVTRADLKACAANVLARTREITRRAVEDVAGLTWTDIHDVVLVGGQTLMPLIQEDIVDLTGLAPHIVERPQDSVALGAGEYGHIFSLGRAKFHENSLINVIALPLGIRLDDNTFEKVVPANVTVPHTSAPFTVTTVENNQTKINVEVLQGPRGARQASECVVLGNIAMEVPAAPARTLKFDVAFDVLSNGTLKITVTDVNRKRTETLDVVETRNTIVWRDQPAG